MPETLILSVPGADISFDLRLGNIPHFALTMADGRRMEPLHRAPPVNDPGVLSGPAIAPVDHRLAGEFFCAPFGPSADAPPNNWTANGPWEIEDVTQTARGAVAFLSLLRPVMGARVTKELRLVADLPMLIQTHRITGGAGALTVAHHPVIRLAGKGWLSVSQKARALTGDRPMAAGRNRLNISAECIDITKFPGVDGAIDLRDLPGPGGHEDFVVLVEVPGAKLGWTALIREAEDDLILVLKDPAVLPVTMLWLSNGGNAGAPLDGCHAGVLAIKDGCAAGLMPPEEACAPNPVSAVGVPTALALALGRVHEIRHVISAAPRPTGWTRIVRVEVAGPELVITERSGEVLRLPFARGIFANGSSGAAP